MAKQEFAPHKGYVYNKIWSPVFTRDQGYVPISLNQIENIEKIIQKKGKKLKAAMKFSDDYLFQGYRDSF